VGRHPKKQNGRQPARDLPWEEAIQRVLTEAGGALHYADIAERIVSGGLRRSVGATPASTVGAYLSNSLREKSSPYLRVGRGQYTLRATAEKSTQDQVETAGDTDEAEESGALRAFGMFWRRELVLWSGPPKLLGKQGAGATDVNFADQVGVYLLHDRERVIYVGRAIDTLFARLKTHTTEPYRSSRLREVRNVHCAVGVEVRDELVPVVTHRFDEIAEFYGRHGEFREQAIFEGGRVGDD
jgi:hypothetical protein